MINKIFELSHHFEMIARRVIWSRWFNKFFKLKYSKKATSKKCNKINFKNITKHLKSLGVKDSDILIVHSAYGPFKYSDYQPKDIIKFLIKLIPNGTLVMPGIRKYKNDPIGFERIYYHYSDKITEYDPKKTPIWTGVLPKTLALMEGACLSLTPLNSLIAYGQDAKKMFSKELHSEKASPPNGENSGWAYCLEKNAWIISLGVGLTHNLTSIHTTEDIDYLNWPVKGWYRTRKFRIKSHDQIFEKEFLERHPRWGMLHFAERKLNRDLIKNNILRGSVIDGLTVDVIRSIDLHNFLDKNNAKGYPYFWVSKYLK